MLPHVLIGFVNSPPHWQGLVYWERGGAGISRWLFPPLDRSRPGLLARDVAESKC